MKITTRQEKMCQVYKLFNGVYTYKGERIYLFEIYTFNNREIIDQDSACYGAKAGEVSGWEIETVYATKDGIKQFPFFDKIITTTEFIDINVHGIIWK